MGTSQPKSTVLDPSFPLQNYLNRGLSKHQILTIRSVFESYQPRNGAIDSHPYRQSLEHSQVGQAVLEKVEGRESVDFELFFEVERQLLLRQLQKDPTLEVESTQVDPPRSWLCPYAEEVVRN